MNQPEASASPPPTSDTAFAAWLAARAGEALLALRAEVGFADPAALRAAGDRTSHGLLRAELARWRPADAVLSEEDEQARRAWPVADGNGVPSRLTAGRVWIVDPLDGTREFAEEGRTDWAVHVALWARDAVVAHHLAAGAVALPARGQVLTSGNPPAVPAAPPGRPLRLAASRSRPPGFLTDLADELGAELVPMGSAGVKVAAVIHGEVDAYVHAGGQYEWDSAAPVAVATAAGLHASRIDGSPLGYNAANPRLPDLLVCRADLAPVLLRALRRHLPVPAPTVTGETPTVEGRAS